MGKVTLRKARPGEMFFGGGRGVIIRSVVPQPKPEAREDTARPENDDRKKKS